MEERGNLVEEYMQGSVKIRVFDSAYAGKSKEEIDKVLDRLGQTISKIIDADVKVVRKGDYIATK